MNSWKIKEPFELELGGTLRDVLITYHTYGQLNAKKDNVIVVLHALSASSDAAIWWSGLFGIGNFLDPDKYFIICANNLGSPYGTTSPKFINPDTNLRYGLEFPEFTIRDTARLNLDFLNLFGIEKIKYLIGSSCGGNIAQEMAIIDPDKIDNLILICCSVRETPWVIAIHESQRIALRADPTILVNSNNSAPDGLNAARAMALPFYRAHASLIHRQWDESNEKTSDFRAASYINYQGQKFVSRFDAHCYYKLLTCLDTHNVGRGRESIEAAFKNISADTLCIGFNSDLLIPSSEQKFLSDQIPNSKYKEIQSIFGHDSFLIETDSLKEIIFNNYELN